MAEYDVIVIGGGPGGYVAAVRAGRLGREDRRGGAGQGRRALSQLRLHPGEDRAAHRRDLLRRHRGGSDLGIKSNGASIDWPALPGSVAPGCLRPSRTASSSSGTRTRSSSLHGEASLSGGGKVKVGDDEHQAKAIILATGSVASPIPGIDLGPRDRHLGRLFTRVDAEGARGRRRRRVRLGDRLCVRAHGGRGDLDRDARPAAAARGQGHGAGGRAPVQEGRHGGDARHEGRGGGGAEDRRQGQGGRGGGEGRLSRDRGRAPARYGPTQSRCGRRQDQRPQSDRDRRVPAHLGRRDLRDRRSRAGPRSRPQGRGGRRRCEVAAAAPTEPVNVDLVPGATFATRRWRAWR